MQNPEEDAFACDVSPYIGLLPYSAAEQLAYSVIQVASPTINVTLTNILITSAPYHHKTVGRRDHDRN